MSTLQTGLMRKAFSKKRMEKQQNCKKREVQLCRVDKKIKCAADDITFHQLPTQLCHRFRILGAARSPLILYSVQNCDRKDDAVNFPKEIMI